MSPELSIEPIGAAIGAEIKGLDIAAGVSDDAVAAIKAAWAKHLVMVIRSQSIEDLDLLAFSRCFGELDPPGPNPYGKPFHEQHPEINVISNIIEDGQVRGNLGAGEAVWHADLTYIECPPKAGILYALEIPSAGGNTYFSNMYLAYETLPRVTKDAIEGLVAIHDASHNSAGLRRKGYEEVTDVRLTPGARHPLVRTDPETGRKCLFLGRRPRSYVVGLDVADSEGLLDRLWAHAAESRFSMCHQWQVGDLLMWSNLEVLHRRDAFDADARRRLHRTQIKGVETIA